MDNRQVVTRVQMGPREEANNRVVRVVGRYGYLDTSEESLNARDSHQLNKMMQECFAWAHFYKHEAKNTKEYDSMQHKIIAIQARLFPDNPIQKKVA